MIPPSAFPPLSAILIALVIYWCVLPFGTAPERIQERRNAIALAARTAWGVSAIVGWGAGHWFGRAAPAAMPGRDSGGATPFGAMTGIAMGTVIAIGVRWIGNFYYLEPSAGHGNEPE